MRGYMQAQAYLDVRALGLLVAIADLVAKIWFLDTNCFY